LSEVRSKKRSENSTTNAMVKRLFKCTVFFGD
jgi:hypothetical protein